MSSTPEKTENFGMAERLIREAASAGAELVALPELWSCHVLEEVYEKNAETIPGPTTDFLGGLARELGLYVLGGSILEGEPDAGRFFNTSTFFDPSGALVAVYRKIHLFDVKALDREYVESRIVAPGREIVIAKAGAATLGLSVCYDLRAEHDRGPLGTVLGTCPDRDGHALATLDLDYLDCLRTEFPALANRRPEAYDW